MKRVRRRSMLNFSPRLGFAFDPRGNGRTSVRASVGMFYDFPSTLFLAGLNTGAPFSPRVIVTDINLDNPWANYPDGDPHPMLSGRSLPKNATWGQYSSIIDLDYDTPNVRVFAVEPQPSEASRNGLARIGELSRKQTTHLWSIEVHQSGGLSGTGSVHAKGVVSTTCSTTGNRTNAVGSVWHPTPATGQFLWDDTKSGRGGTASYTV